MRPGQKVFTIPGPSWGVRVIQPAAGPVINWSLYFDGVGDWVDCGNNPSIMNLHAADFTCDVYFRTPAAGLWANFSQYFLGIQGVVPNQGWWFYINTLALPNANVYFYIVDGLGVGQVTIRSLNPVAWETWYYVRGRRFGNVMALSVNAGAEHQAPVVGATLSAQNLFLGRRGAALGILVGSQIYVHLWNNNQGALGAVPVAPFPLGANTAARWRFQDAPGAVLVDDTGINNGNIVGATWQPIAPLGWTP